MYVLNFRKPDVYSRTFEEMKLENQDDLEKPGNSNILRFF